MRKRDELADQNSCLNRAADDEWLFVLLGHDEDVDVAVLAWARAREGRIVAGEKPQSDMKFVREAREWVAKVRANRAAAIEAEAEALRAALPRLLMRVPRGA